MIARRAEAFGKVLGKKKIIHITLVTTNGLAHNAYRHNVQAELTLDDLFRE